MSELFDELQADIKQEKLDELWRKTGKWLMGAAGAIVLITIGYQLLDHRRTSLAMERTSIFFAAMEKAKLGNEAAAIELLKPLTEDTSSHYYGPVMLKKAGIEKSAGDNDAAQRTYEALAQKDDAYGQLAKLYLSAEDSVTPNKDTNAPYYRQLKEREGWQLLEQDKKADALAIFTALYNDPLTSAPQRMRLQEVLEYLAPETLLTSVKAND